MRGVRPWLVCGAAGFMLLSLGGARVDAQTVQQGTAPRIQSVEGVDTYKAYCAVCHGPAAKGNGPAATALKKVPADLTTMAKRSGGKFSEADVEFVIMGQQVLASHVSRAHVSVEFRTRRQLLALTCSWAAARATAGSQHQAVPRPTPSPSTPVGD